MDLILDSILEDAFDDIVDDAIEDGEVESTDDEEQMYEVPVDTPEEYSDPYIMYSDDEDEGENDYEDGSTYEVGATDDDNDLDTVIADLDARIAGEDAEEDEEDIFVQESAKINSGDFITLEDGNITLEAFDSFINESYFLNNIIEISESAVYTEGFSISDLFDRVKQAIKWLWDKIVEIYIMIKNKIKAFFNGDLWLEKKAKEFKNAKINVDEIDESAMLETIVPFSSNPENGDSNNNNKQDKDNKKKESKQQNSSKGNNKDNDPTPSESENKSKPNSSEDDNKDNNQTGNNSNSSHKEYRPKISIGDIEINRIDVSPRDREQATKLLKIALDKKPKEFFEAIKSVNYENKDEITEKCKTILGMDGITFNNEMPAAMVKTEKNITGSTNKNGKQQDTVTTQSVAVVITSTIEGYVYNTWFNKDPSAITVRDAIRIKNKYCDQYLELRKYIDTVHNKNSNEYAKKKNDYMAELNKLEQQFNASIVKKTYRDSDNKKQKANIGDKLYYIELQKMREICNVHTAAIKSNLNAIVRCINVEYRSVRSSILELMMYAGFIDRRSINKVAKSVNNPVSIVND